MNYIPEMDQTKKKSYRCQHVGCNSSFNRPYRLAQHLLFHNNQKAFKCELCLKTYTSKSHLNRHVKSVHQHCERDVLYSCPKCLQPYANRQNLIRHIKTKHTEKKTFVCDFCNKDFKKKYQLKSHMFQHTGIKAFSCEICIQDFKSLYDKRRHMKNHKTYTCNICDIQFERWSKYIKHRKSEHEQKEFICDTCARSFKQRTHLVRHIKRHTQLQNMGKKFPCPYENCQRAYSRNSNLNQHILIKHVKMLHECSICKAQLCSKAKLKFHMKRHEFPESKRSQPKTKITGRKLRKDLGVPKINMAVRLTGYIESEETNIIAPGTDSTTDQEVTVCST